MSIVRHVVRMGRSLRVANDLKIRQPLSSLTVVTSDPQVATAVETHTELIIEELNVKRVDTSTDEAPLVTFHPRANFKALGPKLGARMKNVAQAIEDLGDDAIQQLVAGNSLDVAGVQITSEDVIIDRRPRPGLVVGAEGTVSVVLDCELTPQLAVEGLAREVVNRIQALRREMELDVTDRIHVQWDTDSKELAEALVTHAEYIREEVLATSLQQGTDTQHEVDVGGAGLLIGMVVAPERDRP
jgi:isoleucyl-tRNA synthetase